MDRVFLMCKLTFILVSVCLQVTHVEPWEKGSRKTAGQTGMCGGVSGKYVLFIFPIFPPPLFYIPRTRLDDIAKESVIYFTS